MRRFVFGDRLADSHAVLKIDSESLGLGTIANDGFVFGVVQIRIDAVVHAAADRNGIMIVLLCAMCVL